MKAPKSVRNLTSAEKAQADWRFSAIASERDAPVEKYPLQKVWWPATDQARAIAGGIVPRQERHGYRDAGILESFFSRYSDGQVLIGDLGGFRPYFRYVANYDSELAPWIRSELLSDPTCLLSTCEDLVFIANEQLNYSVVGASVEIIENLEYEWGGREQLRKSFEQFLKSGDFGFDVDDERWAARYLMPWSTWE